MGNKKLEIQVVTEVKHFRYFTAFKFKKEDPWYIFEDKIDINPGSHIITPKIYTSRSLEGINYIGEIINFENGVKTRMEGIIIKELDIGDLTYVHKCEENSVFLN